MDQPLIVVTGGCGFIGSNFIRLVLEERPGWQVANLDALTYAGNPANLSGVDADPRYRFFRVDVSDPAAVGSVFASLGRPPDRVVHFAAETHVDRSILDPLGFVRSNVTGTAVMLEAARAAGAGRFLHVSTDEVYGALTGAGRPFDEGAPHNPTSPYAASKVAAEALVASWHRTFGLDTVVTRCSNNYGPYQFPEKLIPLMIINAAQGRPLPVYGAGRNVRDWIHVSDHCRGILAALDRGRSGRAYNLGAGTERTNLEIVELIADLAGGRRDLIRFIKDRPGHDFRYAVDTSRAREELGWQPLVPFGEGLRRTVDWYLANGDWWRAVTSGDYQRYYAAWYGKEG